MLPKELSEEIAYSRGYIKTPQEIALLGGGHQGSKNPYTPMVLQEHSQYVGEIQEIRAQRGSFDALGHYFGLGEFVKISVEPLDKNGNTVRDPVPLDDKLQPVEHYTKSPDFPLRRD